MSGNQEPLTFPSGEGKSVEAFLPTALQLPRAHGEAVGSGDLRSLPEDFFVREWLGFSADGAGDHWLLTIRKRGANTQWVAKQLAKLAGVHPRDVGFAGLKDRDAVTEQAFTVPVRAAVADWDGIRGEGFEVLRAERHRRKLKRGALKGNEFEITVRRFVGDVAKLAERLELIRSGGVPNYFGPQRYGRDLGNLHRAARLFSGERIEDRLQRGFALSAARAYVFNAVLAHRVALGTWSQFIEGDVANLDGSNSIFVPDVIDAALQERSASLDIHPTGPLWGSGELRSSAAARAIEESVADAVQPFRDGLERIGLDQERRALRLRVAELTHSIDETHEGTTVNTTVKLRFRLGRGAFATTVMHEILANAFDVVTPEIDE